jgi:hypothetical protein
VKIETSIRIEAPPPVVFRFYGWLDHLRFVSASLRQEWCEDRGVRIAEGGEYAIQLRQGRHSFALRFRTLRVIEHERYEDEFLTWPVKGGRHVLAIHAAGTGSLVSDANIWSPPWYARALVAKNRDQQHAVFEERLAHGRRIIEAVYSDRGDAAFADGVFEDCARAGILPSVQDR